MSSAEGLSNTFTGRHRTRDEVVKLHLDVTDSLYQSRFDERWNQFEFAALDIDLQEVDGAHPELGHDFGDRPHIGGLRRGTTDLPLEAGSILAEADRKAARTGRKSIVQAGNRRIAVKPLRATLVEFGNRLADEHPATKFPEYGVAKVSLIAAHVEDDTGIVQRIVESESLVAFIRKPLCNSAEIGLSTYM